MTDNSHALHVNQDTQGDALILLRLVEEGGLGIGLSHRDTGTSKLSSAEATLKNLYRILGSLLSSQE